MRRQRTTSLCQGGGCIFTKKGYPTPALSLPLLFCSLMGESLWTRKPHGSGNALSQGHTVSSPGAASSLIKLLLFFLFPPPLPPPNSACHSLSYSHSLLGLSPEVSFLTCLSYEHHFQSWSLPKPTGRSPVLCSGLELPICALNPKGRALPHAHSRAVQGCGCRDAVVWFSSNRAFSCASPSCCCIHAPTCRHFTQLCVYVCM